MSLPTSRDSSIRRSASTSVRFSTSGRKRLLAREGEQLPHQRGRAVGILLDVHDVREGRVRRPVVGEQQVGRHDDGGEHVVEIMCDAAGQLADGLHLLALRHLDLERLLLGRLDGVDDRRLLGAFAAGAVGDRIDVEADVPLVIVGQHGVERRDVGLPLLGLFERRGERSAVAFVNRPLSSRTRRSTASRSTTDENNDRNGALVRTMRPLWSTPAIAIGVELKKRVNRSRTPAARPKRPRRDCG